MYEHSLPSHCSVLIVKMTLSRVLIGTGSAGSVFEMRKVGLTNSHVVKIVPKSPSGGPDRICSVLSGVVDGLSFLESKNQEYGALHPGNILIGRNNCGVLGDFFFTPPSLTNPQDIEAGGVRIFTGTCWGPSTTVATSRSDVWSFRVIVMESVVGVNPFKDLSSTTLRTGVNSFDLEKFVDSLNEEQKSRMTPALKQLLSECLQITPTDRTTFSSIRQRRLLRSLLTTQEEINTFNEAIILHQQEQLSQSIFAPALASVIQTVNVIEGSSGERTCHSTQDSLPPTNFGGPDSIGTIMVDGHVINRDITLGEAGVTSDSIFIVLPSKRFYIMEYIEAHHRMNAGAFLHDCSDSLSRTIDKYTLHGKMGG
ncbi:hypothetical protein BLNAU_24366 [Blattamonas nauphoetae]|uniref:Protein kinase domain-containing protein n=1 Tax=Blattamonas nauphoetae TaxID=2049346 RepID=A0ABQ9WML3_9EUKA|nr:hypothetical protein BLNAU_24366 [Blattamonas nauphoetae]